MWIISCVAGDQAHLIFLIAHGQVSEDLLVVDWTRT